MREYFTALKSYGNSHFFLLRLSCSINAPVEMNESASLFYADVGLNVALVRNFLKLTCCHLNQNYRHDNLNIHVYPPRRLRWLLRPHRGQVHRKVGDSPLMPPVNLCGGNPLYF